MSTRRCVLVALLLAVSPMGGRGQSGNYWLITQATGKWEYRTGPDDRRQLTGKYDCLIPDGEVRCLETDLRRCELRYLTDPETSATKALAVRLPGSGAWVSLKKLAPPPPAVLPTTADALVSKFTRVTKAGGSRAVSGCGGSFPLKAPTCGENIDLSDFKVRWQPTAEAGARNLILWLERVDGQPLVFRRTIPA